jgi:AraC-like DNA-binding protein
MHAAEGDGAGVRAQLGELAQLLGRHAAEGEWPTAVPRLALHRRTQPTAEYHGFFPPALSVVVRGSILASVGGEACHEYDASSYVVTSLDLPTASRVAAATPDRPYLQLMLALPPERIAAVLAEGSVPEAPAEPPAADRAYWRAPVTVPLLESVSRLVRLLDEPDAIPFLAPSREREVIYRLLTGAQGVRLRALAQSEGRSRQVGRAIALLKSDLSRPLYVEELASVAHMSPTSFHRHFKALTTLSPVQYQKRLRLHEARRLMLLTAITAAQAAERVGYQSASQFNRDYRRVYGSPPHRDVAAAFGTANGERRALSGEG